MPRMPSLPSLPRLPSLPSLPSLRQRPRPLLDVVNLGSSGHGGHSPKTPTRRSPMSSSTASPANPADPASRANPADFSRARSAAVGALTGAAVGAYHASALAKTQFIANENNRRAKATTPEAPLTADEQNAFLKENEARFARFARAFTVTYIAGVASGGGSIGLKYATDVNANNSAVKRGNAPKSGFRRYHEAALAGGAGFFVGAFAGSKAARYIGGFENPKSGGARGQGSDVSHVTPGGAPVEMLPMQSLAHVADGVVRDGSDRPEDMPFGTRRYL